MGKYVIHNGNLYSADELYHYGVKGMKWGVRKNRANGQSGLQSARDVQRRIRKASWSDMRAIGKLSREYASATRHDYQATVKYAKKLLVLAKNKDIRNRWIMTLDT